MESFYPAIAQAIADDLNTRMPGWRAEDGKVDGPGNLCVVLEQRHDVQLPPEIAFHVDIGFVLNRMLPEAPVVWDCTTGYGATPVATAVRSWLSTTALPCLELVTGGRHLHGRHADGESFGLPGLHALMGDLWGIGDEAPSLADWLRGRTFPSELSPLLAPLFAQQKLTGIKLLLSDGIRRTAEVRVDGMAHPEASALLGTLDWPTPEQHSIVKAYYLFIEQVPLQNSWMIFDKELIMDGMAHARCTASHTNDHKSS
ncbi:MAG: DUF6348 family protein [Myxococcota bacterium]